MQNIDVVTQAILSQCESDSTWLAAELIKKRAQTEHFKQRAVIKFCANSELTPTETWTFLENIIVGKRVLDGTFLTGTSDFGKVERTSATISGVGCPLIPAADLSTFKSHLRGTRVQKREELEFAVRRAAAKFGIDFHKDVCSEWVERHMQCAVCGGPYDPNFICIL